MPASLPIKPSPDVAVILPAGGQGFRLGGERKQFRRLGGKPIYLQTLRVFLEHPRVAHIVLVVPEDAMPSVRETLHRDGIDTPTVVAGGKTRQQSVFAGLLSCPPSSYVLVHDAVRPFIRPEQVSEVIRAVERYGAAAPAIPVTDTVRRAEEGLFGQTVSREDLFAMQTPQGFRTDWLLEAHRRAADEGFESTDDVELVRRIGHPVHVAPGDPLNIKITGPYEWDLARRLWPSRFAK